MLHPMNLPSERSNLGVVIKTEAGVTVPRTPPNHVHRTLDYTGLRAQAAILNRACDSEKEQKTGAWWKLEGGRLEELGR